MTDAIEQGRRVARQLTLLPRGLRLAWDAAPRWTAAWLALLAIQGLLPAAMVALTRPLVNSLTAALAGDPAAIRPALGLIVVMAGLMIASALLRSLTAYVRAVQAERVSDHVSRLLHTQSMAVDLAFYDLPDYFDHLHRARREAGYRPVALLESAGSVVQHGITLVAIAALLAAYGPWVPVVLLLSTLPALFVVLRSMKRVHDWRRRTTAAERRTWYYDWLLTSRETAAELRLFGLGPFFRTTFEGLRFRLRDERLRLARDQGLAELAASLMSLAVAGLAILWMLGRALAGTATLGDVALFYAAFNQGQSLARGLVENIGQILSNSLFLGDLFDFLGLKPAVVDPPAPAARPAPAGPAAAAPTLRFEGVTFAYPRMDRPVLEGFDLEIPGGYTTAIVGTNGAGKSTLIKLLCRFYDPQGGRITLDGVDLRALAIEDLRRQMTVLFQTPVQFCATAAENIAFGDVGAGSEEAAIRAAAAAAGVDALVRDLPQGYATPLGVLFDQGVDLSVGQWQRLALARAYHRPAPLLILDEPTSALDPWAEADWLARFRTLSAGRTALVITHRFSTARHADFIHVMDGGRIVESGTHAELRAAGGPYAVLWHGQLAGRRDGRDGAATRRA